MGYAIYFRRKTKMSCSPVSQYLRRAFSLENKTPFCLILLEYKDDFVPPCWRWLNKNKNKQTRQNWAQSSVWKNPFSKNKRSRWEHLQKRDRRKNKKDPDKKTKKKFFFELNSFLEEQMSTFSPLLLLLLLHTTTTTYLTIIPPTLKPISLHLK